MVESKLNLHLYITGSFFYTVVFLYRIFFLVSYIAVMNLANCLSFGSVINDSISFMVWLAVWSKSNCRLSAYLCHTGVPYGLVVRIPAFHAGGPGSIPGMGRHMFYLLCEIFLCYAKPSRPWPHRSFLK